MKKILIIFLILKINSVFLNNIDYKNLRSSKESIEKIYPNIYEKTFDILAKSVNYDKNLGQDFILSKIVEKYGLKPTDLNRYLFLVAITKVLSDYVQKIDQTGDLNNNINFDILVNNLSVAFEKLVKELNIHNKKSKIKKYFLLSLLGLFATGATAGSFYAYNSYKDFYKNLVKLNSLYTKITQEYKTFEALVDKQISCLEEKIEKEKEGTIDIIRQEREENMQELEKERQKANKSVEQIEKNIDEHLKGIDEIYQKVFKPDERGFWQKLWGGIVDSTAEYPLKDAVSILTQTDKLGKTVVGVVDAVKSITGQDKDSDEELLERLKKLKTPA